MKGTVGIVERVEIIGESTVEVVALFDTGAQKTSIDVTLAAKARLGPIVRTALIRNPSHSKRVRRPVVDAKVKIGSRTFHAKANIQDRSHMSFPVIIGRDIITGNFVVDTHRNHDLYESIRKKDKEGKK